MMSGTTHRYYRCDACPGCASTDKCEHPAPTYWQTEWERRSCLSWRPRAGFERCTDPNCTYMQGIGHYHEAPRHGQLSAEDRASMFMDWCALHGFGLSGWPPGARDQLIAHIRQGERPFPLKD